MCVRVYEYFSHVRFCWTTGISNLITPPAPDLRSLGRRAGGAANCYLQHLKQHTITLLFHFSLSLTLSGDTFCVNLGLHTVAWEGARRDGLVNSFITQNNYASVTFLWFLMSFLHWTTKSLCRRGEDSCAFKCEKDAWCAHSIESFVREITWSWGHLFIFWISSLCKTIATVDLPPTVNSTK